MKTKGNLIMNTMIYKNELKLNILTTLIWTVAIFICATLFYMFLFRFVNKPKLAMTLAVENFNILNIVIATNSIFWLIGTMFSAILGSTILSKEEFFKTSEVLYSFPVTRFEIIFTKFLVIISCILIVSVLSMISQFIFVELYKTPRSYDIVHFLYIWLNNIIVLLFFGGLGFFLGSILNNNIILIIISIIFSFVMLVLSYFNNWIAYLSIYKYIDHQELLQLNKYNFVILIVIFLLSTLFISTAFIIYQKKNIK